MTRWLILCTALISLPLATDKLVDYQFRHDHPAQNIGYSKEQVNSLGRLIDRVNGKTASTKTIYVWRDKKAAMLADVWNLTPDALDSAVDILGRRR